MATHKKNTSSKQTKAGARKKSTGKKSASGWSKQVNETSDALDLENGVFTSGDPKKIARSLKRSAEKSDRRKSSPYRSAMSMLSFYINRGGKNLTAKEKKPLEDAKDELRKLYGKDE